MQSAHPSPPQTQQNNWNSWCGQLGTIAAVAGTVGLASVFFSSFTVIAIGTVADFTGAEYAKSFFNEICKPDTAIQQRKAARV